MNKIENRITFTIKKEYYIEILTVETTTFSGSTKAMITKDKNDEKVAHLEITKVVLVHFNIVSTNYQFNVRGLYKFVPNK